MEEIKSYKNGIFCWVDLGTIGVEDSKKFYIDLFGWEAFDTPAGEGMTYTLMRINDKDVSAVYEMNEELKNQNVPPHWISYIAVDNVDETMNRVAELGGKVIMEPFDVMEEGRMGILSDPAGAVVAVWQAMNNPGTVLKDIPGALCWFEHASHDTASAIPFYEKLFGWTSKTQQMDNMEYTMFYAGEETAAGMYQLPPEMEDIPAHWLPYFMVADLDDSIAKAESGGGNIIVPKTLIPDMGSFAIVQDPQGAVFGVFQGQGA